MPIYFNEFEFDTIKSLLSDEEIKTYTKIIRSNDSKCRRIRVRIKKMLKHKCWFCTFTISDDNMSKNHSRKLKEMFCGYNYIFNEDYGSLNNRKHYHGIIECDSKPQAWSYGFCNFKLIDSNQIDIDSLSRYINKLTAHALKGSSEKIIYSRKK